MEVTPQFLHVESLRSAAAVEFISPGEHDGIFVIARSIGGVARPGDGPWVERFALRRASSKGIDQEEIVALSDMLRPVTGDRLVATLLGEMRVVDVTYAVTEGVAGAPGSARVVITREAVDHDPLTCGGLDADCPTCRQESAARWKASEDAEAEERRLKEARRRQRLLAMALDFSKKMREQGPNPEDFGHRADPLILAAVIVADMIDDVDTRLDGIEGRLGEIRACLEDR